ncbi:16S rRNA (uracil(1498)-N(3))-methyltransferase [Marihabitans asiaticum]|uniref:Ribosomal RNA small subunit methyltransferase E n=1 Tax=Marihabitans asiaticum TaxID=415218 RepID=A0A560WAB2_9MICO|nr:16S rRNA (uracil(1498)-N(3))-methyltransferase [Marihabitans asiaticum]TWD14568.1 16S rRNA (uracil1498-N3)-methyltransferase [Marihabitans asiaticum]
MTAQLYLVPPGSLDALAEGGRLTLIGEEARHAATVKRVTPGEQLLVADGAGRSAAAVVAAVGAREVDLVVESLRHDPEPRPRIVLVQALVKGGRDEDAIEAATELGVDEVIPWEAERCIVRWKDAKRAKGRQKWTNVVTAATKQSRRSRVPAVGEVLGTAALLQRIGEGGSAPFVLHEQASTPLATLPEDRLSAPEEIVLVVGPEGGIAAGELSRLEGAGATAVRLGPSVLRAGVAGPAAIAVIAARLRWG